MCISIVEEDCHEAYPDKRAVRSLKYDSECSTVLLILSLKLYLLRLDQEIKIQIKLEKF